MLQEWDSIISNISHTFLCIFPLHPWRFYDDDRYCFCICLGNQIAKKMPGLPRPYKAWGYPWSTILSIIITIAMYFGFALSIQKSLLVILVIGACLILFIGCW